MPLTGNVSGVISFTHAEFPTAGMGDVTVSATATADGENDTAVSVSNASARKTWGVCFTNWETDEMTWRWNNPSTGKLALTVTGYEIFTIPAFGIVDSVMYINKNVTVDCRNFY